MQVKNVLGRFVTIPLKKRFWDKVDKNGPIHPYDTSLGRCWLWTGRKSGKSHINNYGRTKENGRQLMAHRVAWELSKGRKLPRGKALLHTCDNPPCVNPNHTYPGTAADNHRDMIEHGRSPKGEKHGRANITDDLARKILRDFPLRRKHGRRSPEEQAEFDAFFKRYNVSYSVARNISTRRGWKHI